MLRNTFLLPFILAWSRNIICIMEKFLYIITLNQTFILFSSILYDCKNNEDFARFLVAHGANNFVKYIIG